MPRVSSILGTCAAVSFTDSGSAPTFYIGKLAVIYNGAFIIIDRDESEPYNPSTRRKGTAPGAPLRWRK